MRALQENFHKQRLKQRELISVSPENRWSVDKLLPGPDDGSNKIQSTEQDHWSWWLVSCWLLVSLLSCHVATSHQHNTPYLHFELLLSGCTGVRGCRSLTVHPALHAWWRGWHTWRHPCPRHGCPQTGQYCQQQLKGNTGVQSMKVITVRCLVTKHTGRLPRLCQITENLSQEFRLITLCKMWP